MKLRYYADSDIRELHNHVLRLLEKVHDNHDIPVETDRINEQHGPITDFPGEVQASTREEVYKRDLKRNHALNESIEPTPSEGFKRYGRLDIAGNVAVVDNEGTVRWASTLPGYADGYGPGAESQTAMDFLEDIAISPNNRICVECLNLLDGDESFCPNCGHDLS